MKDIGSLGEQLTAKWLELRNYDLLQRNWSCRWGEIDIIARHRDDNIIAFVEVKTRSRGNWDKGGLLAVDFIKQEKIIKTASLFLARYPQLGELPCRFDVALVGYIAQRRNSSISCGEQQRLTLRLTATRGLERGAEEREAEEIRVMTRLDLGKPVIIDRYQMSIEDYIQSAFELS